MRRNFGVLVTVFLCGFILTVRAVNAGDGRISGLMFGDLYWVAANHESSLEDRNGFWLRRIYFTYDHDLNEAFSTRLRLEMSSAGDFHSDSKLEPFVKDAYLRWKRDRHSLFIGISPTPQFSTVEPAWGLRPVEKTPLDLQKMGSTRDFGLAVKGGLDAESRFRYHVMFSNGSGTGSETDEGKKVMGAIGADLNDALYFEAYADFDNRPGDTDRTTLQGLLTYRRGDHRLGLLFAHQTREIDADREYELRIASVYAVVQANPRVSLFGRFDRMFDPNPAGESIAYIPFDNHAESNLIVAGFDAAPIPSVHVMPNVEMIIYEEDEATGVSPDTDVMLRLTFFYTWK